MASCMPSNRRPLRRIRAARKGRTLPSVDVPFRQQCAAKPTAVREDLAAGIKNDGLC